MELLTNVNVDIEKIKKITGLDFGGADTQTIIDYVYEELKTIVNYHNKNLTKKQYNVLQDLIDILENINACDMED